MSCAANKAFIRSVNILLPLLLLLVSALFASGQNAPNERSFPQSKPSVEKKLKGLQSATAGRLPLLDGFTVPGDRPLDRFRRAYYQCSVTVSATPSGGSLVRVSAKITAWYADPSGTSSGYQVLPSNGRLENDLMDQLSDALGTGSSTSTANSSQPSSKERSNSTSAATPLISAPMPRIPQGALVGAAANKTDQPATLANTNRGR